MRKFKIKKPDSGGKNTINIPKNCVKLKVKPYTSEGKQRAKSRPPKEKESIYGLDVDFLKDIGKEEFVKVSIY